MEAKKIIESIQNVGRRVLPEGSSLYLYGSRARGDALPGSDWDLLLLLDKEHLTLDDYALTIPFRELGWDKGEEISPQVYSRSEWEGIAFSPFYKNVEHDKTVLL